MILKQKNLFNYLYCILFFTVYLLFNKSIDTRNLSRYILWFSIIIILFAFYDVAKILSLGSGVSINNIELIKSTCANKNLLASLFFLTTPFLIENLNSG